MWLLQIPRKDILPWLLLSWFLSSHLFSQQCFSMRRKQLITGSPWSMHSIYLQKKTQEPQLFELSKNMSSLQIGYGRNFLCKPFISTIDNKIGNKSWLERAGSHAGRTLLPECKSRGNRGEWALVNVFTPHDQKTCEQQSSHEELLNPPDTA